MARSRVKLPALGEGVDTAVVVQWHASVGEEIQAESALVTVETDKVDTDIPSPLTGILVEVLAEPGAELSTGDPLCIIEG